MKSRAIVVVALCGLAACRGQTDAPSHAQHEAPAEEHAAHPQPSATTSTHDQHATQGDTPHEMRGDMEAPGTIPAGRAPVLLDAARRQSLGVKTERVTQRSFTREVRATGIVRVDERLQSHIHVKFEGFVERVFVNFVGRKVRQGEPLLSVYSPELLAAETELAQAYKDRDRPRTGPFAATDRAQTEALIQAAHSRLALLDVPSAELARLERTRDARRSLTITSPITGTIVERNVVDGMRVMPETTLMVVADLRNVWVMTDIFEHDLGAIGIGQHAVIEFVGDAAPAREGRVGFVSPTLDETTRTAKVRIELDNKDGVVRPGLFAAVKIHIEAGNKLAVPASAVIDTGMRKIVFVEAEPGRFEPRAVKTGALAGDVLEVVAGLAEGDSVAVSAQFLLDSESQIRGGPSSGAHGSH